MQNRSRASYCTDLKIACKYGLIADDLLSAIPRSTLSGFRRFDESVLVGAQLSPLYDNLDSLSAIASSKTALRIGSAIARVAHLVKSLGCSFQELPHLKNKVARARIVTFVDRLSSSLPRSFIQRLLGLSSEKLCSWARNLKTCISSPFDRCRRIYPTQLIPSELRAIKRAFSLPLSCSWPASSVAWKLIHDGIVNANVATILRYAKALGLTSHQRIHRSRKRGSLAVSFSNQAWHMDATVLSLQDGTKAYLQLVLDNFSRRIIAYQIESSPCALHSEQLLRSAFASIADTAPDHIDLIVDGGSENNSKVVEAFLTTTPIRKLIARVDVSLTCS